MSSGAFLTSESSRSNRPSIFTLLAAEGLSRTIQPALEHCSRILAERNPSKFGHFWRFSDEIHLFLDFFLQRHYLEFYQSTFSENFYGLERKFEQNSDKRISIRRSLILSVFVSYAKLKSDRMFEKIRIEKPKSKFEKCFLAVYPYIHMTWEGTVLAFCLLYSVGKTDFHSPWNFLIRCQMQYAEIQKDFQIGESSSTNLLKRFGDRSVQGLATVLTTGLQFGAFFLQFLDWWYANKPIGGSLNPGSLPIPPPPSTSSTEGSFSSDHIFQCPICLGKAQNETLLPVSGLVFCYRCILQQLRTEGKCPVTQIRTSEEHLIRVFHSGDE